SPQLADGQRRDALERLQRPVDDLQVGASLRMGDERDRQLVHAWVSRERARVQNRQLPVVAFGKALAYFPNVPPHDVNVVQKPLASGSDVRFAAAPIAEAPMCVL